MSWWSEISVFLFIISDVYAILFNQHEKCRLFLQNLLVSQVNLLVAFSFWCFLWQTEQGCCSLHALRVALMKQCVFTPSHCSLLQVFQIIHVFLTLCVNQQREMSEPKDKRAKKKEKKMWKWASLVILEKWPVSQPTNQAAKASSRQINVFLTFHQGRGWSKPVEGQQDLQQRCKQSTLAEKKSDGATETWKRVKKEISGKFVPSAGKFIT